MYGAPTQCQVVEITETVNRGLGPRVFKSGTSVLKSVGQDSAGGIRDMQENFSDEKWT